MKNLKKKFDEIAHYLLNRCIIKVNGIVLRICEVEFYYCGGAHQDTFAHCDEMQKLNCHWYFHKNGKKFRSGNYKGLDITFGSDKKGFGGILLRAISNVDGGDYISGPCLLVNKVLELCNVSSIDDLVVANGFSLNGDHVGSLLYLEESNDLPEATIYGSPRFGLTLKEYNEARAKFIMQDYRYVIFPEKNKKGKPHIAVSLHRKGTPKKDIGKIIKSTPKNVDSWISTYEEGTKKSSSEFEGMKLTNNDVCSLYGCCSKLIY